MRTKVHSTHTPNSTRITSSRIPHLPTSRSCTPLFACARLLVHKEFVSRLPQSTSLMTSVRRFFTSMFMFTSCVQVAKCAFERLSKKTSECINYAYCMRDTCVSRCYTTTVHLRSTITLSMPVRERVQLFENTSEQRSQTLFKLALVQCACMYNSSRQL